MAPEASAGSFLNYVFLLVGMVLISLLLQSLVRFEAIRAQTIWAVSVHLSDHAEEHVSRTADQIWGQVQDTATSNPEAAEVTAAIANYSEVLQTGREANRRRRLGSVTRREPSTRSPS